jgi:hypothetical protein
MDFSADAALPEPLPLFADAPAPEPFPIHALGVIGAAAADIARQVECPQEIAVNTALAGAALAVSGLADVRLPHGEIKPLNLFLVTLAASNDRKSTVEKRLMRFARTHQKRLDERYMASCEDASNSPRPRIDLIVSNPTVPAIIQGLQHTRVCGLFSDEGSAFFSGHSMRESGQETLAILNQLFDGQTPRDTRVMRNTPPLYGRRVSCNLMMQPGLAAAALMDSPMANQNGFMGRVLLAQPQTMRGARFSRDPWTATSAITGYEQRASEMLSRLPMPPDLHDTTQTEKLKFSPIAAGDWFDYRDECERLGIVGGEYEHAYRHILRSPEMAGRIAAILHKFDDCAGEISADTVSRAITVARWYRDEVVRIVGTAQPNESLNRAARLAIWLRDKWLTGIVGESRTSAPGHISTRELVQRAGCHVGRKTKIARTLMGVLAEHHWAASVGTDYWDITPCAGYWH